MNCDLLFYLFNDFIGGADDDNMSMKFLNLDLNNDDSLHKFIQYEIKPSFETRFSFIAVFNIPTPIGFVKINLSPTLAVAFDNTFSG